jgi:hypothetical protein
MDSGAFDTINLERDHAVIEQQGIAIRDVFMQGFEGDSNAVLIPLRQAQCTIEEKSVPVIEVYAAVLESSDTYFRALQVTHQADVAPAFFSGGSQRLGAAPMIRFVPVREIDPRHVEARINHLAQRFCVVRRGSKRRDNLCPSLHGGRLLHKRRPTGVSFG